eukprot:TRINITY_DN673_c0_g1_i2.p1 TRINITY_DN673_c0_g1~~TRINITY_DN673_c0_g1_i2.p1  ORF type:complete len:508 (-),score=64.48 TRINITY_DN673_c0_g1_i2:1245-2768(-)
MTLPLASRLLRPSRQLNQLNQRFGGDSGSHVASKSAFRDIMTTGGIDNVGGAGPGCARRQLKLQNIQQRTFRSATETAFLPTVRPNNLYREHFHRPDALEPGNWGDQYGIPDEVRPHVPIGGRGTTGLTPNWTVWRRESLQPVQIESHSLVPHVHSLQLVQRLKHRMAEFGPQSEQKAIRRWHLKNTPFPSEPDRRALELQQPVPRVAELLRRYSRIVFLIHGIAEPANQRDVHDVDRALQPTGRQEAEAARELFARQLGTPGLIVSCHSARCLSTAAILRGGPSAPVPIREVPEMYFRDYADCVATTEAVGFSSVYAMMRHDYLAVQRYCASAWRSIYRVAMDREFEYIRYEETPNRSATPGEASLERPTLVVVGHAMWLTALVSFIAPQGGVLTNRIVFRTPGNCEGFALSAAPEADLGGGRDEEESAGRGAGRFVPLELEELLIGQSRLVALQDEDTSISPGTRSLALNQWEPTRQRGAMEGLGFGASDLGEASNMRARHVEKP